MTLIHSAGVTEKGCMADLQTDSRQPTVQPFNRAKPCITYKLKNRTNAYEITD